MPVSVEDQLRQLGGALDDLVDEVPFEELIPADDRATGAGRHTWLLSAAAVMLVVSGVVAVALVARSSRSTTDRSVPLADIPAGLLPADADLQAAVDTEVGRFELYDHPDAERFCLFVRAPDVASGRCWPNSSLGTASAASSVIVDGRRVVFGALRPSERSRAALRIGTVPMEEEQPLSPDGARTVDADDNGIWYVVARETETHFVAQTDCCQTVGPIPPLPGADLVDVMADTLPPGAMLRGSVDTAVGRYRVYDVSRTAQVCVTHTLRNSSGSSGCYDVDRIETGLAWGATSAELGAAIWGLAPVGQESEVTIAGTTVVPNDLGFWFAQIDENVSEFTVDTPCCRQVIPLGAPLITIPGSTTITDETATDVFVETPLLPEWIDGIRTTFDDGALYVAFTGADEYEAGAHCTMRYVGTVDETSAEVTLRIHGERPAKLTDEECTAEGPFRSLQIDLSEPLAGRPVVFAGS